MRHLAGTPGAARLLGSDGAAGASDPFVRKPYAGERVSAYALIGAGE